MIGEHCCVAAKVIDAFLEEEANGRRINLCEATAHPGPGERVPALAARPE